MYDRAINLTYFNHFSNEIDGVLVFEPGCIQPDPTDKLLEEMKSFKVSEPFDVSKLKGLPFLCLFIILSCNI